MKARVYMWRGKVFAAVNCDLPDDPSASDVAKAARLVAHDAFGKDRPEWFRVGWWDGLKVDRISEPARWAA